MELLKELFTNSRLGLGAALGVTVGYLMGGNDLDGIFGAVMVGCIIIVVIENMILKTK